MKKYLMAAIALLPMVALTSPIYAADEMRGKTTTEQQQQLGSTMQDQSARELLGMEIKSQNDEDVGTIQDIKLDAQTGRVKYVTISKGGVLGVGGEKGIPVPLEAFRFSEEGATLTVDKGKLDTAPQPTGIADEDFRQKLETHYGVSPAWQPESGQQMQQPGTGQEMQKEHMRTPGSEQQPKSSPY